MKAADRAVSLPPRSISCSAAARIVEPLLVRLVPLGHPRVEVPAVVVEPRRVGDRAHVVERLALELPEADGDVSDLHAGVVDVVLDFDRRPRKRSSRAERVAERGVAQVADVGRLVRVDRGVLDDRLARPAGAAARLGAAGAAIGECAGRSRKKFT